MYNELKNWREEIAEHYDDNFSSEEQEILYERYEEIKSIIRF
mgnify:CR=1 FL=1